MGVGRGGREGIDSHGFWNLTVSSYIFITKGCFRSFEGEKWNFTTFDPLMVKSLDTSEKSIIAPIPWKNLSDGHG